MGFFLKTRSRSGFYQKNLRPNPKPGLDKNPVPQNYKNALYIYIYTYNLTLIPISSVASLPQSNTPSPSFQLNPTLRHSLTLTPTLRHSLTPPSLSLTLRLPQLSYFDTPSVRHSFSLTPTLP